MRTPQRTPHQRKPPKSLKHRASHQGRPNSKLEAQVVASSDRSRLSWVSPSSCRQPYSCTRVTKTRPRPSTKPKRNSTSLQQSKSRGRKADQGASTMTASSTLSQPGLLTSTETQSATRQMHKKDTSTTRDANSPMSMSAIAPAEGTRTPTSK